MEQSSPPSTLINGTYFSLCPIARDDGDNLAKFVDGELTGGKNVQSRAEFISLQNFDRQCEIVFR
jgi:hypothetical protein